MDGAVGFSLNMNWAGGGGVSSLALAQHGRLERHLQDVEISTLPV